MKQETTQLFGKRGIGIGLGVALLLSVGAMQARATHVGNFVWCDANGNGIQDDGATGINGVTVRLYKCGTDELIAQTTTANSPVTGEAGWYEFDDPPYTIRFVESYVRFVLPAGYRFSLRYQGGDSALDSNADPITGKSDCFTLPYEPWDGATGAGFTDRTIDAGLLCSPPSACWLTGGGTIGKIRGVANYSFGGVVYPGCSPKAAEGGNWNVIDHFADLHFQGQQIIVDSCSGVETKSPKVSVNIIDFHGTGIMSGIGGNPAAKMAVTFVGRAVDNHESGGNSDKLYLHVVDGAGYVWMHIGGDDAESPATISTGNLQIHTTGCD